MTLTMASHEPDPGLKAVLNELNRRRWLSLRPGNKLELGEDIGLSKQAISKWTRVPATRALAVEKATGISRHVLRPDVFGPPKAKKGGRRVRGRNRR